MKQAVRSMAMIALVTGIVLAGNGAHAAQNYLLTGKFASSVGPSINNPLIGNNPGGVPNCGQTTMNGAMIPGMSPIYQGYRTSITMTMVASPPITMTMFRVPGNCDVTGNGACNGQDANAVRRAALGQSSPLFGQNCPSANPLVPCPECG